MYLWLVKSYVVSADSFRLIKGSESSDPLIPDQGQRDRIGKGDITAAAQKSGRRDHAGAGKTGTNKNRS